MKVKFTDEYLSNICKSEGYTFLNTFYEKRTNGNNVRYMNIIHNICGKEYSPRVDKFISGQRCTCQRKKNKSNMQINAKIQVYTKNKYSDELVTYIMSFYNKEVMQNYKCKDDSRGRYQLDLYIPDKHLGISIDKIHSNIDSQYNLNKTKFYKTKGIRVIHVFEDEYVYKKEIVFDKLYSMITKMPNIIYARKCDLFIPTPKEKRDFLNKNHIQGDTNSAISFGLSYEGKTVAIMSFAPHKGRGKEINNYYGDNAYDLTRYATSLKTNVIGGFGKLLKTFQNSYDYNAIVSYGDIRYTSMDNNIYTKFNFKLDPYYSPKLFLCKRTK